MHDSRNCRNLYVFLVSVVFLSSILALDHWSSVLVAYQSVASSNSAILNIQGSALGNIEEGQTIHYTPANQSDLNDIISVSASRATVYLHLDSNLDSQSGNYDTYDIVVKFDTVPTGSSHNTSDTACTLSLTSPDYGSINLDVAGSWTFDFEVTTTAKSGSADQRTTVTITVSTESM